MHVMLMHARYRPGHQVSPAWHFPASVCAIQHSDNSWTATYTPAGDTNLARGDALIAACAAAVSGDTLYLGNSICDIQAGASPCAAIVTGVNMQGVGIASYVLTTQASREMFYAEGTSTISNMKFSNNGTSASEALLQKKAGGDISGTLTLNSVTVAEMPTPTSPLAALWVNTAAYNCVINNCNIGGIRLGGTATISGSSIYGDSGRCIFLGTTSSKLVATDSAFTHTGAGNRNTIDVNNAIPVASGFAVSATRCTINLDAGTGAAVLNGANAAARKIELVDCIITGSATNGVRSSNAIATNNVFVIGTSIAGTFTNGLNLNTNVATVTTVNDAAYTYNGGVHAASTYSTTTGTGTLTLVHD